MALIVWLFVGLIAGAIARLLVPGRDRLGLLGTMALGLAGSLLGGLLGNLVSDDELRIGTAGIIGSVIGAVIILLVRREYLSRRERAETR